jgi:hypothetical protein
MEVLEGANTSFENSSERALAVTFLEVKSCSEAIFAPAGEHGKSPCFLRCCFSAVVGVAQAMSVFASVYVGKFLECA